MNQRASHRLCQEFTGVQDGGRHLIQAIKEGGQSRESAIRFIYSQTEYKNRIRHYILNRGGQEYDVDEIFTQAVAELDEKIRKEGKARILDMGNYLFGICRMLWKNRARKNRRRALAKEGYAAFLNRSRKNSEDPWIGLEKKEQKKVLAELLRQLGEPYCAILKLWMMHYSMEEIAEQMGLANAHTARVYKYRAVKRLVKMIGGSDGLRAFLR